ncbi:MAG: histidine--tRNA ligase [Sedimentisphaerales bacterium]|nr:histidine--tRNA ligase [Sedimentisphaerales bacterium]
MTIPPVKGTRDFYPSEMAVHNWIVDGWKKISLRNGFQEYDGPIFEYLKMYQVKSGDEIVEQLFSLTDRGGRDLALRPEMTPTLARMVNQKINALAKPIKWFSVPRLFRAERPQKGRLREFFQWNIDIIGIDNVLADAEVIFTTIDYLRQIGLTSKDIKVKISSREFLAGFLKSIGIPDEKLGDIYVLLDKSAKLPPGVFEELLNEQIPDKTISRKVLDFMVEQSIEQVRDLTASNESTESALEDLSSVFDYLENMGVGDFCIFDPGIVRGLAYYTGIVFEVHDAVGELRAICGGGRYDNLLKDFGGPSIPATGMGMGDCVLEILLSEKGLLDKQLPKNAIDYFVAYVDDAYKNQAVKITMELRSKGMSANFSYKAAKLNKQLKQASDQNAGKCIIIGQEIESNQVAVKDMTTSEQKLVDLNEFLSGIHT